MYYEARVAYDTKVDKFILLYTKDKGHIDLDPRVSKLCFLKSSKHIEAKPHMEPLCFRSTNFHLSLVVWVT